MFPAKKEGLPFFRLGPVADFVSRFFLPQGVDVRISVGNSGVFWGLDLLYCSDFAPRKTACYPWQQRPWRPVQRTVVLELLGWQWWLMWMRLICEKNARICARWWATWNINSRLGGFKGGDVGNVVFFCTQAINSSRGNGNSQTFFSFFVFVDGNFEGAKGQVIYWWCFFVGRFLYKKSPSRSISAFCHSTAAVLC